MTTINRTESDKKQEDDDVNATPSMSSNDSSKEAEEGGGRAMEGTGDPSLRCTQCSDTFQDAVALLNHLDTHSLSCPVCQKVFTSRPFLENHMKSHESNVDHDIQPKETQNVECDKEESNSSTNNLREEASRGQTQFKDLNQDSADADCKETLSETKSSPNSTDDFLPEENSNGQDTETCKNNENVSVALTDAVAQDLSSSTKKSGPTVAGKEVEKNNNNNVDSNDKCGSEERETKSNCSVNSEESLKVAIAKPYKCSKCKYTAKCVASVHIHQRRNHPGEWTTVVSTLPDSDSKTGEDVSGSGPASRKSSEKEASLSSDEDDEDDQEVRRVLHSPVMESDEEGDGEEAEREYRCSICTFTAKDTQTVFDHQRTEHPGDWQLNDADADGMEISHTIHTSADSKEESVAGQEAVQDMDTLYHLPTVLDQYSQMGRSIIAGTNSAVIATRSVGASSSSSSSSSPSTSNRTLPGNQMQYWQGYNRLTGRFHCPNCPAYFYEPNQHSRHLKMCMKDCNLAGSVGQYRCLLCKRVFPDMETLRPHMTSHQRYFRAFRCSTCGYNAKFEGTILAHIRQRHLTGSGAFIERIAEPTDIQNIPNKWEKITDATISGIEAEEVTDDPDLQRLFGGVAQYLPNDGRIEMPELQDDSSNSLIENDLQSQTSEHSDEAVPEPLSNELLQSLRVGNNYVCPECPVLFREPNKLRRHMDIHGGIKRHVCNICDKRFSRSEHLKRHRYVHATTKPYMCSICYYSSKRLDNLHKHQKVKHPGENYTVIRVSKEMIEAEIAANSTESQPPPAPAPAPQNIPPPPSRPIKVVDASTLQTTSAHPFILSQPANKPKRGRPRKISSPDEMFVFSRDPDLVGPNTTSTTSSVSGDMGLMNMMQQQHAMTLTGLQGGVMDMNGPSMNSSRFNITSTPIRNQTVDLSSIAAAAAAEASATPISIATPITIAPISAMEEDGDLSLSQSSYLSGGNASEQRDCDSPKANACLLNRGKYQCHVCDRPFSYLKPFKKHLLCHGTFMPYQCSICGHQTKRRDMMQDHQKEHHPGANCDIQVMEPTSDMHDMMDTYIQKQPDDSPQASVSSHSSSSNLHSIYDESMVDPQVDVHSLGLNLPVKIEPSPTAADLPKIDKSKPDTKPDVQQFSNMTDSSRSTSSPSVISNAVPSTSFGMVKPRPRRLIKFKVLSSHNRTPRPAPPSVKPDASSVDNKGKETKCKEEKHSSPTKGGIETRGAAIKRPGEELSSKIPSKIVRASGDERDSDSNSSNTFQDEVLIGTAPRMSIMGLRPRQKLLTPKHYDVAFKINKDHKPGDIVVDLKSNKGTPKAKQGDNHRYSCSVCDQRFAYEKPFKRHLLVHGGFEPYRCNVCGHQTTSRDTMKIHQNKRHPNVRNAGITVLDPTPDMEQSLIRQGLLQPTQPDSDEEDVVASKSIVETARIEQHLMQNAMKTLSATVKGNSSEQSDKDEQSMPSFHSLLGLKPKNEEIVREDGTNDSHQVEDSSSHSTSMDYDDISDMPVDEALFANIEPGSSLIIEPRGPGFACEHCGKSFQCSSKLQRHLVTHTGMKAYECQICYKKLTRLEHLKRHLLTHGNLKPYRCSVCKFDAKRLDIVQLHQQTSHPGEPVEIEYLFTPSVMTNDRSAHQRTPESSVSADGNDLTCSMCGGRFSDMGQLLMHQKLHSSGLKPYECFICHKTFTRPEHLKRHRLVHDDTKPYRCSECGFKTKRLDGMREHQRSRHPSSEVFIIDTILPDNPTVKRKRGRPPKFGPRDSLDGLQLMHCDKCCLAFYDQGRFEQHKITHIPTPPKNQELTCHLCGVRVSQAKHLRRHMLLHQAHSPYQCSMCFYTAKRTDHMKLHFRKSHPDDQPQIIYVSKDQTASSDQPVFHDESLSDFHMQEASLNDGQSDLTGNSSSFEHSYLSDQADFFGDGSYMDGSLNDGSHLSGSNFGDSSYIDGDDAGDDAGDDSKMEEVEDGGMGEEVAEDDATAFSSSTDQHEELDHETGNVEAKGD